MVSLFFSFIDESILVCKVTPDPFFTIKQQANNRFIPFAVLLQESIAVRSEKILITPVINSGPGKGLRFFRFFYGWVKERIGIKPEIFEIFHTAIEAVLTETFHHLISYGFTVFRSSFVHCINKVWNTMLIQISLAILPERRLQGILHQMHHDKRGPLHFPFPGKIPVAGFFQKNGNTEIRNAPILLEQVTGLPDSCISPVMICHVYNFNIHKCLFSYL